MERSNKSHATLTARMRREDDYGVNEDSNSSNCVRASIKEDSQRTTTPTDKKTTKTKDLQCMMTHKLASTTLTDSQSVSGYFTHCFDFHCTSCRQFNLSLYQFTLF